MDKKDFLFEIGVEELPAGYIKAAIKSLSEYFSSKLTELKLPHGEILEYSTPRRLAVMIKSLAVKQEDERVERLGPAKKAAIDENGNFTKAAIGFAAGLKLTPDQLTSKNTEKGEYLLASYTVKGQATSIILEKLCVEAISKIPFPKTMCWNDKQLRFARPIRWLLALYGNEVVKIEYAKVTSDRISYGKIIGKRAEAVVINNPSEYLQQLQKGFVIADRNKRRELIRTMTQKLTSQHSAVLRDDDDLLEEVTDIVEFPTAVLAEFSEEYLQLPEKLVSSTLAKNQKYFTVYDKDGNMRNIFIFIADNHPEYAANTKSGNEKVVKARLDDAVFYFNEDIAKNIAYFNEKLKDRVFHAKLGTVWKKVERIVKISEYICDKLALTDLRDEVSRSASICKFDLASSMIGEKEFTSLQGYVGKNYAERWGEKAEVALAIEEHYYPQSAFDPIPSTMIGAITAIADKIDTLCGIFGIGIKPTGSNDPFALKRAGGGLVRILCELEIALDLNDLTEYSFSLLPLQDAPISALKEFFNQRIDWFMQSQEISYDIVNSVLAIDEGVVLNVWKRASSLQKFRIRDDFSELILGFKRVTNIISTKDAKAILKDDLKVDETLFTEEGEKNLYESVRYLDFSPLLAKQNYAEIIEELIKLRTPINNFFDNVMVNVDEEKIRNNRYALLNHIRKLFLLLADLSLIVAANKE